MCRFWIFDCLPIICALWVAVNASCHSGLSAGLGVWVGFAFPGETSRTKM